MYGILIIEENKEDVIRVASSREKINSVAKDFMLNFIKKNKIDVKHKDCDGVIKALEINEIEMAIDLFSILTDKSNKSVFLALSKVKFELDS